LSERKIAVSATPRADLYAGLGILGGSLVAIAADCRLTDGGAELAEEGA
jgi:hypothetical protein